MKSERKSKVVKAIFKICDPVLFLVFVFVAFSADLLSKENSKYTLGPLPPISVSLDAPVRMDEENLAEQHNLLKSSQEELLEKLKQKHLPEWIFSPPYYRRRSPPFPSFSTEKNRREERDPALKRATNFTSLKHSLRCQ